MGVVPDTGHVADHATGPHPQPCGRATQGEWRDLDGYGKTTQRPKGWAVLRIVQELHSRLARDCDSLFMLLLITSSPSGLHNEKEWGQGHAS